MTMTLLLIVVASGVFGLTLQQFIPRRMTQSLPFETVYAQLDAVNRQIIAESDALVSATTGSVVGDTDWSELNPADRGGDGGASVLVGASRSIANIYGRAVIAELPAKPIPNTQIIASAYESDIRTFIKSGRKGLSILKDPAKCDSFFADLADKVVPEAQFLVDILKHYCDERRQLDHQITLHHWLHVWLGIHLPLSMALLVLLIWHAIVATKYSGIFSFF